MDRDQADEFYKRLREQLASNNKWPRIQEIQKWKIYQFIHYGKPGKSGGGYPKI